MCDVQPALEGTADDARVTQHRPEDHLELHGIRREPPQCDTRIWSHKSTIGRGLSRLVAAHATAPRLGIANRCIGRHGVEEGFDGEWLFDDGFDRKLRGQGHAMDGSTHEDHRRLAADRPALLQELNAVHLGQY